MDQHEPSACLGPVSAEVNDCKEGKYAFLERKLEKP